MTTNHNHSDNDLPLAGSPLYLAAVCLVASLGGLLFGFDTAVISGTFSFVQEQFSLTDLQVGWFGSSALLGCIFGALVAGTLGDRFGRKPILIIAAVLFFISSLFSAIPPSFAILIPARVIGGVGVGMASVLAPMYISEFAPSRLRGRLVACYQLSIVIGILAAYFCNSALLQFSNTHPEAFGGAGWLHWILAAEVWRGMFAAEMIPAGLFFLALFWVPESPRWLAQRGQQAKALWLLARVDGRQAARREMDEIRDALDHEEGTMAELFRGGLCRALLVGVGVACFGELTGVNFVVSYGPTVLQHAGFEQVGAFQFQVGFGLVNLIFTLIALSVIDRLGRRPLLIGGMSMVVIALAVTGLLFLYGDPQFVTNPETAESELVLANRAVGPWIAGVLTVYMASVALSICAVIWVLTPEIFPNRVRGRAMSIATLVNWSTNALSAFLFPWYVHKYGMHVGFLTFAVICLIGTVFFWRLVPETKGKSLEEIEQHWLRG